jgi:hypothetical protein
MGIRDDFRDACRNIGGDTGKSIDTITCETGDSEVRVGRDRDGYGVAEVRASTSSGSVKASATAKNGVESLSIVEGEKSMKIEGEYGTKVMVSRGEQ